MEEKPKWDIYLKCEDCGVAFPMTEEDYKKNSRNTQDSVKRGAYVKSARRVPSPARL